MLTLIKAMGLLLLFYLVISMTFSLDAPDIDQYNKNDGHVEGTR